MNREISCFWTGCWARSAPKAGGNDSAVARIAAVDYVYDKAFDRELPDVLRLSVETWRVPEAPPVTENDLDRLTGSINLIRITAGSRNG
ncbi:MAG: hypothetical protein R3C40_11690 [Parvularculaceae bacterium]